MTLDTCSWTSCWTRRHRSVIRHITMRCCFIVQHQVAELWIKLLIHEIGAAIQHLRSDELPQAVKNLARVRHIQNQLYSQWKVLDTLTPAEYAEFRYVFGKASGFQSAQYRILEFTLGNKNHSAMAVYEHQPEWYARLEAASHAPSLYEEFLLYLNRRGMPVPQHALDRDFSELRGEDEDVIAVLRIIRCFVPEKSAGYRVLPGTDSGPN